MLIKSNLLPILAGGAQAPAKPVVRDNQNSNNDRVRFIIDAPAPKVQGSFDSTLGQIDEDNAASQAGSFQLLLQEQQSTQIANGNAHDAAPFEAASNAYTAAENASQFNKPVGEYLGAL